MPTRKRTSQPHRPNDRIAVRIARALAACVMVCVALAAVPASAETIDEIIGRCPTAAEIAAIDAVITIQIEADPSAPTLVCSAAAGSQNMTRLRRNVYNVLRAAQRIRFSQPLPWSNQTSVWDWLRLESGINLIRLRGDIGNSFCCDPSTGINLLSASNSYLVFADKWVEDNQAGGGLVSGLALILHEARHRNGGGHTCGTSDQTIAELGAWGAQIQFYLWLDRYADHDLIRPATGDAMYYRNLHIQTAEDLKRSICQPPVTVPGTVVEFYNATLNHYFMTISAAEAQAIDAGSAGPGWTRTGVTFHAWPNAASAPLNSRPVCRFYGSTSPGPNSHFYTVEEAECAALKALQATTPATQPRWNYEGTAFYVGTTVRPAPSSTLLQCGQIPNGSNPLLVSRFYNKRALQNDSNHRYTIAAAQANQMTSAGWAAEGIVMCAAP